MNTHDNTVTIDSRDLAQAVEVLKKGGVILYPTDTVWGLGCDASNPEAVARIYEIKKREDAKSMLTLVGSEGQLQSTVADIPDVAWQLIDAAVRPLTIIYSHPRGVAPNLLAPDGSLGVRITSEPFSQRLCQRLGHPVVSTSANQSGKKTPTSFADIDPSILECVDYVVGYGRNLPKGRASDIIKVADGGLVEIIR